ncbi:NAD(P)-dependent oxidoreductase [Alteromonas mediterranea]|uniref:NAD(P)-dependent oxidoreductase n=1 Tax=Alteromonas mediterranea TaxID=314275 RepID=UPI00035573E4|nr:NAD(P)-dependent oxidoreductase [Alteromonas mediterranea]AGP85652.1 oxidoreductase [Alteromonas mediterranea U4]AGP89790.1 oxidoreductase [Alteromonas mediterranea U7]AGP93658.1 oxidoreductase [Alteromonas mediterranea U8]
MSNLKVSFLGLGVMGFPMAGHLSNAGYSVNVYNRTVQKALAWATQYQKGGANVAASETVAHACEAADIVFMCVGNDNDVREVATQALQVMKPGSILVDHTTASADIARELYAACKEKSVGFLDAPVSGGQAGAENGQLTIMVGGDEDKYNKVEPVMAHYARHSQLLGKSGSGQLAKMMNQICIAGIVQGLAEALHFGQKAGLDCNAVVDVISKGAAQSWQMENRASTMLSNSFDFGFAVDWMRKDLSIALDEARKNGSTLALTALVDQYYADVQKLGGGRWDTSSLLTRLK